MRRSIIALLAVGAAAGFASTAAAEPAPTAEVTYTRADLASSESVASLHQRVVDAADQVCRQANRGAYDLNMALRICRTEAVSTAVENANLDALSAFHEEAHLRPSRPARQAAGE